MTLFSESVVEDAALTWLQEVGYAVLRGPDIAVGEPDAEQTDISSVGKCSRAKHQCPQHVREALSVHQ